MSSNGCFISSNYLFCRSRELTLIMYSTRLCACLSITDSTQISGFTCKASEKGVQDKNLHKTSVKWTKFSNTRHEQSNVGARSRETINNIGFNMKRDKKHKVTPIWLYVKNRLFKIKYPWNYNETKEIKTILWYILRSYCKVFKCLKFLKKYQDLRSTSEH